MCSRHAADTWSREVSALMLLLAFSDQYVILQSLLAKKNDLLKRQWLNFIEY